MIVLNINAKPFTRAEAVAALMSGGLSFLDRDRLLAYLIPRPKCNFKNAEAWVSSFVTRPAPAGSDRWMGYAFSHDGYFGAANPIASARAPTKLDEGWYATFLGTRMPMKTYPGNARRANGTFPRPLKIVPNVNEWRTLDEFSCTLRVTDEGKPVRLYEIGQQTYDAPTIERCFWNGTAEILRYGEKGHALYGRNSFGEFTVHPAGFECLPALPGFDSLDDYVDGLHKAGYRRP